MNSLRKLTTYVKILRDLIGLGEDESVSGGRAGLYLANNVLRFKNKGTLKRDKEYGINGLIISAEFYKSRTNASQQPVDLIFDKANGFSKTLSLLHYLITNEKVIKVKTGQYALVGHEDIIFTKKNFREIATQNPQLIPALYDQALELAREFIVIGAANVEDDDDDISSYDYLSDAFALD